MLQEFWLLYLTISWGLQAAQRRTRKKGRGPEFVEALKPYCLLSSFYAEDMLKLQKSVPQVEPPRPDTQFHDDSIVHGKLSHSWIPAMAYYQLDVMFNFFGDILWGSLHPKAPAPKFTAFCMKMPNAGSKLDERLVLLTSVAAFEWKLIEFRGLRACYSEICSTSWPGGLDLHFFHWNFLFFWGDLYWAFLAYSFPCSTSNAWRRKLLQRRLKRSSGFLLLAF